MGIALLCCLGTGGVFDSAQGQMQGRPIEFSEPTSSTLATNVSGLGAKISEMQNIQDRLARPNGFNLEGRQPNSLRPLPPRGASYSQQRRDSRDKNWVQMSPDEMIQSMMGRNIYKLPDSSATEPGGSSLEQLYLQASRDSVPTNRMGTFDLGRSRETSPLGNASEDWNPFSAYPGRRLAPDTARDAGGTSGKPLGLADFLRRGEDSSPEALRQQKAQMDRLEEFRRSLDIQTPAIAPSFSSPSDRSPGIARIGSDPSALPGASVRSPAGQAGQGVNPLFAPPTARLAPTAPLAPGQSSLTPSPSPMPSKPKPVLFSAPQRTF